MILFRKVLCNLIEALSSFIHAYNTISQGHSSGNSLPESISRVKPCKMMMSAQFFRSSLPPASSLVICLRNSHGMFPAGNYRYLRSAVICILVGASSVSFSRSEVVDFCEDSSRFRDLLSLSAFFQTCPLIGDIGGRF
jgi:hypothetical protein